MTDDKDDNNNEKAIKKVVKKHVSDVFGEEEKPPEPTYDRGYNHPYYERDQWKRDNPGFAFQRAGQAEKDNATAASWGDPNYRAAAAAWGKPRATSLLDQDRQRRDGRHVMYDDAGKPVNVDYTVQSWKHLRANVMREVLKAFDWEELVIMPDDHAILEQVVETVMRRCKLQLGIAGNSYRSGSLIQVPISIDGIPPAEPEPLPASSADLPDAWGQPGDEEVIDIKGGDNE